MFANYAYYLKLLKCNLYFTIEIIIPVMKLMFVILN